MTDLDKIEYFRAYLMDNCTRLIDVIGLDHPDCEKAKIDLVTSLLDSDVDYMSELARYCITNGLYSEVETWYERENFGLIIKDMRVNNTALYTENLLLCVCAWVADKMPKDDRAVIIETFETIAKHNIEYLEEQAA